MKGTLIAVLLVACILGSRRSGRRRAHKREPAKRESVTDRTASTEATDSDVSLRQSQREMRLPKLVLDERTSVDDLRRLQKSSCRNITVSQLNKIPPESCFGLQKECLQEFNVTNLNANCLMNISWKTMTEISRKTFNELINSDAENMFFALDDIDYFLGQFGKYYEQFPSTFVAYCSSDPIFAERYAASLDIIGHSSGLAQLFAQPYMEHLDAAMFRFVSEDVLKGLDAITFRHLRKEQLARIPAMSFKNMTPAQFSSIPPANFEVFNADSLLLMPASCLAALTAQQAKHLGADPSKPPEVKSQAKAQRDLEIFSRRVFIDRHACVAVQERRQHIKSEAVWDALKVRCDLIWNGYGSKQAAMKRTPQAENGAEMITNNIGLILAATISLILL